MNNPYFNRMVIKDPNYFFGRKEKLQYLYSVLCTQYPQNISIQGEQRIGKSSLLRYLIHSRTSKLPDNYLLVSVDFLGYQARDSTDFIWGLYRYLYRTLKLNNHPNPIIFEQTTSPRQLKDSLDEYLSELKNQGYYVIFLIDEADVVFKALEKKVLYDVFDYMRSLGESTYCNVSYIIASYNPLHEISSSLVGSKFHNNFVVLNLGLFSKQEALELIHQPSQQHGVQFSDTEAEHLLNLSGHHPFLLQIACYHLFYQKVQGLPFNEDVLIELVYADLEAHMKDWWKYCSREEQLLLSAIVTDAEIPSTSATQTLVGRGLVVWDNNQLKCFSPLFTIFVRKQVITLESLPTMKLFIDKPPHTFSDFDMYALLARLELELRNLIKEELEKLTVDWWNRIPKGPKEAAKERYKQKHAGESTELIHYLDFTSYVEIITQKNNWADVFKLIFPSPEFIRFRLDMLKGPRNNIAHIRFLTDTEKQGFIVEATAVLKLIYNYRNPDKGVISDAVQWGDNKKSQPHVVEKIPQVSVLSTLEIEYDLAIVEKMVSNIFISIDDLAEFSKNKSEFYEILFIKQDIFSLPKLDAIRQFVETCRDYDLVDVLCQELKTRDSKKYGKLAGHLKKKTK